MATTTATLTLSSADLTGDVLSLSAASTLTEAGNLTGLDQTTGVSRKILAAESTTTTLIDADDYPSGPAKNHRFFLRNASTTASEYITVTVDAQAIGRLYAGDFLFMPYHNEDGTHDIKVTTPSGQTNTPIEFILIHQS